ncbi:hypothetical protein ACFSQT_05505 [Mesorhizobium calcicola]|uniref:Uncharacterized protein n=1 Tax=Mesorhizobium calcicola TaxID=1300310 RepID=A0ABW4W934_9HYPH
MLISLRSAPRYGTAGQTPYITARISSCGNERMSALRSSTVFTSAMLATAMLVGARPPASAQALDSAAANNALIRQNDLQILENRVQRQQYQQQQQQYRAQDRQIVQQPQLVVPQLKPSCQTQIIGSTAVGNCR